MSHGPVRLTHHARQRSTEMGLSQAEVERALAYPEVTYPSPPAYGPDRKICVSGRLAVVHSGSDVITVLWRGRDQRHERHC